MFSPLFKTVAYSQLLNQEYVTLNQASVGSNLHIRSFFLFPDSFMNFISRFIFFQILSRTFFFPPDFSPPKVSFMDLFPKFFQKLFTKFFFPDSFIPPPPNIFFPDSFMNLFPQIYFSRSFHELFFQIFFFPAAISELETLNRSCSIIFKSTPFCLCTCQFSTFLYLI